VDIQRAEAHLAQGLLTVSLPRLKDRRGRETSIAIVREQE
jgi:HSP20 family molecular chaperone IbpA